MDKQHANHEELLLKHFKFHAAFENSGMVQVPVNTSNFKIVNDENIEIYEKALEALGGKNIGHYGHASDGRVDGITLSANSYKAVKEKLDVYQAQQSQKQNTHIKNFIGK